MIPWDMFGRIAVGAALGGVIGYERDLHGRPAGLRTHTIVGLASATFMVVSTQFVYHQHFQHADLVEVDASRIAASIVSGMGFLAGGAILRTGLTVQGLTTAAALWLVGAIGMASGSGMFGVAAFVTALGVLTLTTLRRLEDKEHAARRHRVELALGDGASATELTSSLRALGLSVTTIAEEREPGDGTRSLTLELLVPETVAIDRIVDTLAAAPAVRRVRVEHVA